MPSRMGVFTPAGKKHGNNDNSTGSYLKNRDQGDNPIVPGKIKRDYLRSIQLHQAVNAQRARETALIG